jgi:hypothetical protein
MSPFAISKKNFPRNRKPQSELYLKTISPNVIDTYQSSILDHFLMAQLEPAQHLLYKSLAHLVQRLVYKSPAHPAQRLLYKSPIHPAQRLVYKSPAHPAQRLLYKSPAQCLVCKSLAQHLLCQSPAHPAQPLLY